MTHLIFSCKIPKDGTLKIQAPGQSQKFCWNPFNTFWLYSARPPTMPSKLHCIYPCHPFNTITRILHNNQNITYGKSEILSPLCIIFIFVVLEIPVITQYKYLPELLFLQFLSTNYHYPISFLHKLFSSLAGNTAPPTHVFLRLANCPFNFFHQLTKMPPSALFSRYLDGTIPSTVVYC